MQTFLPYASYARSAAILDRQRLGKQRVECLQILRALAGDSAGWRNHPACKMWEHTPRQLVMYGLAVCDEWIERGYVDNCRPQIAAYKSKFRKLTVPSWLGDWPFHRSHQSNLLRKDPVHYALFAKPGVPPDLPYVWPIHDY